MAITLTLLPITMMLWHRKYFSVYPILFISI